MSTDWLLIKRGLYWRPNAQGYTGLKAEAGRYSDADSAAYAEHDDDCTTARIRADEAPNFAPRCTDEAKLRHYLATAPGAADVAEAIATAITPHTRLSSARSKALLWAAQVARQMGGAVTTPSESARVYSADRPQPPAREA